MTYRLLPIIVAAALAIPTLPADAAKRKPHHNTSATESVPVPHTGTIHGTVRAGAKSMSRVAVRLVHKNRTSRSDKSGQFAFHNLKPGTYTLVARTRHHGSARTSLAIDAGQTTDVVLALRPPRPHHHHLRPGGTATPGHTPGHTAGLLK